MNLKTIRNVLRWGGVALAVIGFLMGRMAQSASMANTGRVTTWVGIGMIVCGLVVRMFISEG